MVLCSPWQFLNGFFSTPKAPSCHKMFQYVNTTPESAEFAIDREKIWLITFSFFVHWFLFAHKLDIILISTCWSFNSCGQGSRNGDGRPWTQAVSGRRRTADRWFSWTPSPQGQNRAEDGQNLKKKTDGGGRRTKVDDARPASPACGKSSLAFY